MKDKVAEWLRSLDGTNLEPITDVEPIILTIDGETWEGARYRQRGEVRFYLVGKRPAAISSRRRCCYQMGGDARDWYVACYLEKEDHLTEEQKGKYHPFGLNWIMMPWTAPGKIDTFELKKYRRIPADYEVFGS